MKSKDERRRESRERVAARQQVAERGVREMQATIKPQLERSHGATARNGFCALCGEDAPAGSALRPLGRDDALVAVCASCDGEHPRSGRYSFSERSYQPRARGKGHVST